MPAKSVDIIVNGRLKNETQKDVIWAIAPYLAECWGIGHDITNPLTGIIGLADQLLVDDEPLSPGQREAITQISECADQIYAVLKPLADTKTAIMEDAYLRNRILAIIAKVERITADG